MGQKAALAQPYLAPVHAAAKREDNTLQAQMGSHRQSVPEQRLSALQRTAHNSAPTRRLNTIQRELRPGTGQTPDASANLRQGTSRLVPPNRPIRNQPVIDPGGGPLWQSRLVRTGATAQLEAMGMTARQMSTADYGAWRATNTGLHGAHHSAGQTIITQLKPDSDVAQAFLTQRMKAGLLMIEGALTFVAGTVALGVSAPTGLVNLIVPSVMTTLVGVLKFARGCMLLGEGKPVGLKLIVFDLLRVLEAAAATVGAFFLNPALFFKIPLIIFGIAKSVRSLATAITDYMGEDTNHPRVRKGVAGLATFAHWVEVGALAIAGPGMIAEGGAPKIAGGIATLGVAGMKGVRAADQSKQTAKMPWPSPDADGADSESEASEVQQSDDEDQVAL